MQSRTEHGRARTDMADRPLTRSSLSKRKVHYAGVCNSSLRRLVRRTGECNVSRHHAVHHRMRLVQDIFTTMVDLPWRWTLLALSLSFFVTWFVFGLLWWLIALAHGDLEPEHLPPYQAETGWTPCVTSIYNFTSCFMFSMENQHTTGFGSRMPTEECPEAIFMMCAQAIVGVTIQTAMLGIVFAKIVRPKQRTKTILFSEKAVICLRDGQLCLMFRVADMRKSHIIEAKMHVLLVRKHMSTEGELVAPYRSELSTDPRFFLLWPETVIHRIDEKSPLYNLSADELQYSDLEIVVVLEGTIESTDQRIQARYSYLPSEILWGHRFHSLMNFNVSRHNYDVDYSLLNATYKVDTPSFSAKELQEQNNLEAAEKASVSSALILAQPSASSEV
ncbi:ATP-sensitive inward rectifier potassium channel 12 [Anabrus simplex]|uniref:ATP-sensitive inward rectifier potassium channel 12 n=1 Tax=Anabrus simplex TaxID=316456 RepID=UPI0034DD7AE4